MTDGDTGTESTPRRRSKRIAVILSSVAVVAALTAGVIVVTTHADKASVSGTSAAHVSTVSVTRTDLSDSQTRAGTLGFGTTTDVSGHGSGLVTGLPDVGTTVSRGHELFHQNEDPVMLFYGDTPLFRTLSAGGDAGTDASGATGSGSGAPAPDESRAPVQGSGATAGGTDAPPASAAPDASGSGNDAPSQSSEPMHGRDVTVVADNLVALGYDIGGRVTRSGQAVYTPSLAAAVKRWQQQVGMNPTGTLGPDRIVVLPGKVRVNALRAQLGDQAGKAVMSVTSTTKTVTVPVEPENMGDIKAGVKAEIVLPDNTQIAGTVKGVSQTVQPGDPAGSGGNNPPTVNVSVAPVRQSDVSDLTSAPVQVQFITKVKHGVLAVPVSALVALKESGYALQRPDGTLVPVEAGLFAGGMVEVSGGGITAGMRVEASS